MKLNQRGMSLVEVIVASAVGLIVMAAFSSQLIAANKASHRLQGKLEAIEFRQELIALVLNNQKCEASFASLFGVNVTNNAYSNLTKALAASAPANPLKAMIARYSTNNQFINITEIGVFVPPVQADGTPNTSNPYEFQLKVVAQEEGTSVVYNMGTINISLNVVNGVVDAGNACGPGGPGGVGGAVPITIGGDSNGWRWNASLGHGAKLCEQGTYVCGHAVIPHDWDTSPSDYNFGIACCPFNINQ